MEILNSKNIAISPQARQQAREKTIARGVVYLVPPKKYGYYGDSGPKKVSITPEQVPYFERFVADSIPELGIDLEGLVPQVIAKEAIGLGPQTHESMRKGLTQVAAIPQKVLRNTAFLNLLSRELSEKDKEKLEFGSFNPSQEYITPGTIMRADLLLTESGETLSCDPNLVPLGYSIVESLAHGIEEVTGLPVGATPEYLEGIEKMITDKPESISGIVTTLEYPNWPSHAALAKQVREQTGLPFFVIPDFCIDDTGVINLEELNKFNRAFNLQEINQNVSNVPSCIIRYAREATSFHPETRVVNAPGIRMLETQIWSGLIFLPGFEAIAQKSGVTAEELKSAQQVTVPTILAKIKDDQLQIAVGLEEKDGQIDLVWEKDGEKMEQSFLGAVLTNNVNNYTEKEKETGWFIKTPSTSGKKGTRFTNDGRIDQAAKNITKAAIKVGLEGIFIIQPKIRSTITINGEEMRTKIDFFFHPYTGQEVITDYMATPIRQRAAHGSSSTQIGLVLR